MQILPTSVHDSWPNTSPSSPFLHLAFGDITEFRFPCCDCQQSPGIAQGASPCCATHCLVDVSLHCLTQHPLKHKRVTKLLCLWKEQRIQPLCHQRSAILGTTLNNYSFVSSRIRKFRDSLRWKKPPRPSSPTFDQTNSNSEFEFSFKEAVLEQKDRIFFSGCCFCSAATGQMAAH